MESLPKTLSPLVFAIFSMATTFPAEAVIHRSQAARHAFVKTNPCPATVKAKLPCPGYTIDHVEPLCAGGADDPSNMQWQTVEGAKAKDRIERQMCKRKTEGS